MSSVIYSVVVPCYNSQDYLGDTVKEVISTFESINIEKYEIILINDGSVDNTYEVIKALADKFKNIIGLDLSKNFGQASATLAGLRKVSGDYVIYIDDDGQSPIYDVAKLIKEIDKGYDLVFADFIVRHDSARQKFGSYINNKMAEILINKPIDLHMGNFWISKKYVIDSIVKCNNPYPYLAGLFLRTTDNIGKIEMSQRIRRSGASGYNLKKLISLWLNGFTAFSVVPLRLSTILGFSSSFLGFAFMVYIIVMRVKNPNMIVGYSSLMSVILFIGGMIMLSLGVIGEYVGRTYININKIPQYVIRSEVGLEKERD